MPIRSQLHKYIKTNSGDVNSQLYNCKFLGSSKSNWRHIKWSQENQIERERILADEEKKAQNDILNQASESGANLVFIDKSGTSGSNDDLTYSGTVTGISYKCDSLETLRTLQARFDIEEERRRNDEQKQRDIDEERQLVELYSKPKNWLTCILSGYSNLPTSTSKQMLYSKFKPSAYDSSEQCADAAWLKNKIAVEFGIKCACNFTKLDRRKVETEYGK